ncbi:hypothetical protein ACQ4PT_033317 [Festuca glaucescens]
MKALCMDYEKIHCCPKGCILFRKEFAELTHCPLCKASRYLEVKDAHGQVTQTKKAASILRYLPFIKRLQHLYMSEESARQMMWHKHGIRYPDADKKKKMKHPTDGTSWKHFDSKYPNEAKDARNIPSASGTTPSQEEQGDEDLDAERSVQGEEDEYEEGARGEEGEDVEEEVHQEGEEVPGKAIWIRGPASLPDAPRTENDKLVVYLEKPEALGLVARMGRRPSGILTCILKKYWPGLYRASPNAPKKLALKWEDYQAAPYGDFYKVSTDTDQREATSVLQLMAKKNLKDIFYHARNLAISHYYAEKGERRNKDRVVAENLTIEDAAGWERTEDEEFKAKSIQNKANRGTGGTHNQGNKPFPVYEKDMVAANGGQEIPEIQVW